MPKYNVLVKEVWGTFIQVEAENENDARIKANDILEGDEHIPVSEYLYTLDLEDWNVEI